VDFLNIDITGRVNDVAAVAVEIYTLTGRRPVVIGWSEGGLITGLLASYPGTAGFVSGLGLLSVAPAGFTVPPAFQSLLPLPFPKFMLTEPEQNAVLFGIDPLTGKPTMSSGAEETLYAISAPDTDATWAIDEEVAPALFGLVPAWGSITVPTLVVDGALDPLVGTQDSIDLFGDLTGTVNKELIVFPRNSHAWFLEDNHDATVRVLHQFLSQFK
jgi:pimeloyl-ACP methyl ester carboxylesterase